MKQFFEQEELQTNRSFLYGDGVFESIRIFNGKIPFLRQHYERMLQGAKYLHIDITTQLTFSNFEQRIKVAVGGIANCRLRVTLFRIGGGYYTPTSNRPELIMQGEILPSAQFELNEQGLQADWYEQHTVYPNIISNAKTCNALPYVLAAIYKKQYQLDDVLLLNHNNFVVEASSANVFIVKDKQLITPPLTDGCVAGTMRRVVLKSARHLDLNPVEKSITKSDCLSAEELWLTNAISGIRWVHTLVQQPFKRPQFAPLMVQRLNQIVQKGTFVG
ncbi:MAG: aminotransferase class IV family protein [Saprospiraceae bacterium]|nr:aminotransferase class IV family protein [Saprospiraceae bacterium]MBP7679875.1 aminotransferase class IV family protein [Saprospiraceae bacterium]